MHLEMLLVQNVYFYHFDNVVSKMPWWQVPLSLSAIDAIDQSGDMHHSIMFNQDLANGV